MSSPGPEPATMWSRPERLTAELALFLLSWAVSGLAVALIGFFQWWSVLPLAVGVWAWSRRLLPPAEKQFDGWWKVTIVVALASVAINASFPAEHMFTGRDNGTYLATAGWLAQSGELTVDASNGPLGEHEDLHFLVPGFYDIGLDRILEPQFMHAYPAMLGTFIDIGGLQTSFLLNPLISAVALLALFALARRLVSPLFALVAVLALALGLVFNYYGRATFSEPLMTLFVLTGIWWMGVAEERLHDRLALLSGAMLGAATVVRLDGLVLLPAVTAYLLVRGTLVPESAHLTRRARISMFALAVAGLCESLLISPPYVLDRRSQVVPVLFALLGVLVTHRVLENRVVAVAGWVRSKRKTILAVVVSGFLVLVSYGWFIRPLVTESTSNPYSVESIEEREGLEVGSGRNFSEQSVWWVTWYQGWPLVALATIGCVALMADIAADRSAKGRGWLVLIVLIPFAWLYFWKPSINPDHIWVMRRYLTVVMPLGCVVAALGAERLAMAAGALLRSRAMKWATAVTLLLAVVAPPALATSPVWDVAEFSGLAGDFLEACDDFGSGAQILFLDDETGQLGDRFAQSFRSYCGFQAAWGGANLSSAQLAQLEEDVTTTGGRLIVVSSNESGNGFLEKPYPALERTLTAIPDELVMVDLSASWNEPDS